ncbi:MAG: hypothetical protein IJM67_07045, partial [Atopobiaceae bacterium]|nr:hypothetical protein [Atopobiaceae bacterium]
VLDEGMLERRHVRLAHAPVRFDMCGAHRVARIVAGMIARTYLPMNMETFPFSFPHRHTLSKLERAPSQKQK